MSNPAFAKEDRVARARGYLNFDDVAKIDVSDAHIDAAVAQADLPSLLATLAMLTGDHALIADDLKPPSPAMGASIKPQGGMSEEAQQKARTLSAQALKDYRDRGCPPLDVASVDLIPTVQFLTKEVGDEYLALLRHELALPEDMGAPGWNKTSLAPERPFRVAVIGAGLSGIAAAYRLQQAEVPFVVFEKSNNVGGVWWDNRYPGCRLDTPNFAYSFSFAQKQNWPQQFSKQPEIQRYIQAVSEGTGVQDNIRFETEVVSLTFNDADATWTVCSRHNDGTETTETFHAVITAMGQLNRPAIPAIEGLSTFAGQYFHSAQWPDDIEVAGKRVAVVGTGASAYQIVPTIAGSVSALKVFQRNPPWMLPTPNYHEDIKPGMAWLLAHVPYYGRWVRFWQFWIAAEGRLPLVEVEQGWTHPISVGSANERLRLECMAHLEQQLADRPDLLAKLTPTYPPGAKRMLRDNGVWTDALKLDHADLIVDGIARVEPNGIVDGAGVFHEVDIIVFATGFQSSDYLEPIKIVGRNGVDLHEWWAGDCRAHLGIVVPGFPNLFMTGGPNTGVVVNGSAIFSAECAVEYSLSAIGQLLAGGHAAMDVRMAPFQQFNDRVDAANLTKAWGVAQTTSWYKNKTGRASQTWPSTLLEYWEITKAADLDEYELLPQPGALD